MTTNPLNNNPPQPPPLPKENVEKKVYQKSYTPPGTNKTYKITVHYDPKKIPDLEKRIDYLIQQLEVKDFEQLAGKTVQTSLNPDEAKISEGNNWTTLSQLKAQNSPLASTVEKINSFTLPNFPLVSGPKKEKKEEESNKKPPELLSREQEKPKAKEPIVIELKIEEESSSPPKSTDRTNLLEQIQKGTTLNKTQQKEEQKKSQSNEIWLNLKNKIDERRKAVKGSDSEDESDDEQWT